MLEKLELSYEITSKLEIIAKIRKLYFSTPSDIQSVNLLKKLNVPCYKISSVDLNNYELIEEVCKTGKPIIISTGMSNIRDVLRTKKNS